jgi:hypothetical protein
MGAPAHLREMESGQWTPAIPTVHGDLERWGCDLLRDREDGKLASVAAAEFRSVYEVLDDAPSAMDERSSFTILVFKTRRGSFRRRSISSD